MAAPLCQLPVGPAKKLGEQPGSTVPAVGGPTLSPTIRDSPSHGHPSDSFGHGAVDDQFFLEKLSRHEYWPR